MADDAMDDDADLLADFTAGDRDAHDVEPIIPLIKGLDSTWIAGDVLADVPWTPHLVRPDKLWVCHVHLSAGAPRHISRRLDGARSRGHIVHVALPLEALYDEDVLVMLSSADAYVYVVQGSVVTPRRHHLAALADLGVPVSPALRTLLARAAWDRRDEGTGNQRGRRLEALLAFLLAQVTDFRILKRNFRTDTAEIDIVVQIDNFSTRAWSSPGVPFVLVESKCTADPAGQPVVSLLIRRLETSRKRARLGIVFSAGGFTSDARTEELRLSMSDLCVALFDAEAIEEMIAAADLDMFLEERVTAAMLR